MESLGLQACVSRAKFRESFERETLVADELPEHTSAYLRRKLPLKRKSFAGTLGRQRVATGAAAVVSFLGVCGTQTVPRPHWRGP